MNTKMLRIKQLGEELGALLPDCACIQLQSSGGDISLSLHRIPDNETGMRLTRELGLEDRNKSVFDADTGRPWHTLTGEACGVSVTAYCQQLPPSCKLVTEFKKVPKTETRETGEFIEVPVTRVICGSETN